MPAVFQRSAFHSSNHRYPDFVSMRIIRGAPSINHRPYSIPIPLACIFAIDLASSGLVGVRGSTSTAAYGMISIVHGGGGERISDTEARLRGPMRVYRSPYSAVVTGAFDLITE